MGKPLEEVGRRRVVKSTIAAALTAGVLEKLCGTSYMQNGLSGSEAAKVAHDAGNGVRPSSFVVNAKIDGFTENFTFNQ